VSSSVLNLTRAAVPIDGDGVEAIEAMLGGEFTKAADRLNGLSMLTGTKDVLRALQTYSRGHGVAQELEKISTFLFSKAELIWSMADSAEQRMGALAKLVHLDALIPLTADDQGLTLTVSNGQRCQLRYNFAQSFASDVFVHYILKAQFEDVAEVFTAVRWLHGEDAEEVLLRFRHASVVIGQSVEWRYAQPAMYQLISVGRLSGQDIIFLNGFPVYWRAACTQPPTGITLDVIGSGQGVSQIRLPLFAVSAGELPHFFQNTDLNVWFNHLIASYSERGDLDWVSKCLYAFGGHDFVLSEKTYQVALEANLHHQKGYRDYITDLLIHRLPEHRRAQALEQVSELEPPTIVKVEDVSVKIASNPSRHASLRYLLKRKPKDISLLDRINLRAYAGDIVGIIGKNGAGKSTFLKTLVAAMPLSEGRISIDGRPLLLRPGAGMQGDLTGRENVLKTGLYMGFLPDELTDLMDEIIAFAELEDHIDRPFRYYSDGMRARLIFALATAIPRDILLFDELLSAGDMGFQRKAMKRLDGFIAKAKLVFVVQHTFDFVLSRCTKCLLLDHGRPVYFGDPVIATELYKESL